jgi:signal transduction histidine kinase
MTGIDLLINECLSSLIIPANIKISTINHLTVTSMLLDKEQMVQAITNLMKNAIEAMPNGGQIEIHLEESDEKIHISIKDSGTGIAKENMDKLFTPFFTTKSVGKGTGLGLPTVYGIVKMHKGDLTVKSNNDPKKGPTGTTFTIVLPKKKN